jgi:hypothetical protein
MIDEFYMGAYWRGRPMTLREYANASSEYLLLLQKIHPVFRELEWAGNRLNSTVKLAPALDNLDALIYGSNNKPADNVYENANPDGSLAWASLSPIGYSMGYFTGTTASAGGLEVDISAGKSASALVTNAVTISFPLPEDTRFPHREFYDYDFLKNLFTQVIAFWQPRQGRLISHSFSDAMAVKGLPRAGWLTYAHNPRVAALRNDPALRGLLFETMPNGEPLLSLGRELLSPDNAGQVELARRLHRVLVEEKLVEN